jgi:hypothetical protein
MPSSAPAIASHGKIAAARTGASLLLCALLGGCAAASLRAGADDPARVTQSINLSGFPPEYKRGFSAGCKDAGNASGRSARRPKGDGPFAQGWRDGLSYCRPQKPR